MADIRNVAIDQLGDDALLGMVAHCPDAFAALYRRYEHVVLAYVLRRVATADVAADLHMEVFAAALGRLRDNKGPHGPVAAWLFGIARHKVIDSYRRGRVEDDARRRFAMQPVMLADEDLERIDALREMPEVMRWLDELPFDQRSAIVERIINERDYTEISGDLRCSEQIVRKRVSRGLAGLRARMERPL